VQEIEHLTLLSGVIFATLHIDTCIDF